MAVTTADRLIGRDTDSSVVEARRGAMVESRHRVHVAVAGADGQLELHAGNSDMEVFARSAVKPLQALPLVEDGVLDRYGLGDDALALACASHSGEPHHVQVAARMLGAVGVDEAALACGPQRPFSEASARELRQSGLEPGRIHNNCSGKHAGMLALAAAHGWTLAGYHELEHPVQQRMLAVMSQWAEVKRDAIAVGVDGCGVATFGLPLHSLARAVARLCAAAGAGEHAPERVLGAMARYPELVGGTERLCTRLMQVTGGRIWAKVGAEGVYCAGGVAARIGIALKIEDGAKRAAEPALLAVLRAVDLLSDGELDELSRYARPAIRNTRGEEVGEVVARISLRQASGVPGHG